MELTVPEAARRFNKNQETIRRWIRDKKLSARKTKRGRYLIEDSAVELAIMEEGLGILFAYPSFREFGSRLKPSPIEDFFGDDPGCLVMLEADAIPFGLCLRYHLLKKGKFTSFALLRESEQPIEAKEIENRKVLLVDDITRTGGSLQRAKEVLQQSGLKILEIKSCVYDDFAQKADFWVHRRSYEEYLNGIKLWVK